MNVSNRVIVRHIVVKYMQESICTRYRSWMSTVTWLLFLAYGIPNIWDAYCSWLGLLLAKMRILHSGWLCIYAAFLTGRCGSPEPGFEASVSLIVNASVHSVVHNMITATLQTCLWNSCHCSPSTRPHESVLTTPLHYWLAHQHWLLNCTSSQLQLAPIPTLVPKASPAVHTTGCVQYNTQKLRVDLLLLCVDITPKVKRKKMLREEIKATQV